MAAKKVRKHNYLVLSVLKPFKNNVLPLVYLLEPVKMLLFKMLYRGLPWSSSGKDLTFNAGGTGSMPTLGATIPRASWPKKPKHETEAVA